MFSAKAVAMIKPRFMRLAGHVVSIVKNENAWSVLVGKPGR
jgi:hypothetical protein